MEVRKYKNPEEVADNFARFLANQIDQSDTYTIALSGGSTPKLLFEILATNFKEVISWEHLHVYWGDERCVPPGDSESNYGVANDILFSRLHHKPDIHRIIGENEPAEEAERYSEEIKSNLGISNGLPQFDLIILGMGDDGHTASIFPDQMALINSSKICEVAKHPISGQKRITLTGPVINNAKQVVFLVTGESKANRIREIHYKEQNSNQYPAAHINAGDGQLIWFLDEAAAKYLKG